MYRKQHSNKFIVNQLIFWVVFCLGAVYLFWGRAPRLSDTAHFGGDSWEYQSLAVNISNGHGFKIGAVLPLVEYKFPAGAENFKTPFFPFSPAMEKGEPETLYAHFMKGGEYCFYRTPGYPFFMAGIYKLYGVHPGKVKIIQIFLLAFVAALLPLLGRHYWGGPGFFAGFAAAFFFLIFYSPDPLKIMTETLVVSCLAGMAVLLASWESGRSLSMVFFLGAISGLSVLVKGLNIFLPVIILFYVLSKTERAARVKAGAVFVFGLTLLVAPWSVYASGVSSRPVILATEYNTLILDSNNEDTLRTGGWAPAWRKQDAFNRRLLYNRPEVSGLSPLEKLARFLKLKRKDIPLLLGNKLVRAFKQRPSSIFVVLGMLLYYLRVLLLRKDGDNEQPVAYFPLFCFVNFLLITLIFYGDYRFLMPYMPFFLLPAVYLLVFLLKASFVNLRTILFTGKRNTVN